MGSIRPVRRSGGHQLSVRLGSRATSAGLGQPDESRGASLATKWAARGDPAWLDTRSAMVRGDPAWLDTRSAMARHVPTWHAAFRPGWPAAIRPRTERSGLARDDPGWHATNRRSGAVSHLGVRQDGMAGGDCPGESSDGRSDPGPDGFAQAL